MQAVQNSSAHGLALRNCHLSFASLQLLTDKLKPSASADAAAATPTPPTASAAPASALVDTALCVAPDGSVTTAFSLPLLAAASPSPSPSSSSSPSAAASPGTTSSVGIGWSGLHRLALEGHPHSFGDGSGAQLTAALCRASPHLHTLQLWKNGLGSGAAQVLAALLKHNKVLTALDVSDNQVCVCLLCCAVLCCAVLCCAVMCSRASKSDVHGALCVCVLMVMSALFGVVVSAVGCLGLHSAGRRAAPQQHSDEPERGVQRCGRRRRQRRGAAAGSAGGGCGCGCGAAARAQYAVE